MNDRMHTVTAYDEELGRQSARWNYNRQGWLSPLPKLNSDMLPHMVVCSFRLKTFGSDYYLGWPLHFSVDAIQRSSA